MNPIRLPQAAILLTLLFCPCVMNAAPPSADWFPQAKPLPKPVGEVIHVSSVDELFRASETVKPGGTILIKDGHYMMPRYFEINRDNVVLRSQSGDRNKVVLDGAASRHGELIGISKCRGVTIADLTVQNVKWNGIKINSDRGAQNVTIHNCVIHNVWQRGVKAPGLKTEIAANSPRNCKIQYCLFYNDRQKQFSDDSTDNAKSYNGNYIGGIDVKNTIDWSITDNVFMGIQGRTREGRGCIYISEDGRGCTIERNIFLDSDIAIALGNPSRNLAKIHATQCVVRNNLVSQCPETGILACYTSNCEISGNTIHEPDSRMRRLIWVQNENDGLNVTNNLLIGADVQVGSPSKIVRTGNVVLKTLEDGSSAAKRNAGQKALAASLVEKAIQLPVVYREEIQTRQAALAKPGKLSADVVKAMTEVHRDFKGTTGYVAQFGDSITYSMAFWSAMGWSAPEQYLTLDDGLAKAPKNVRWRDYIKGTRDKGTKFANYSGWKVGQLDKAMGDVLQRNKPEVAIIMIGTNDISGGKVPDSYRATLEQVIKRCLASHCIPIVNTIPPRRGRDEAVADANAIIRDVCNKLNVPLADFHAECLRLRPGNSWDGTVISKDGVHPSGGKTHEYTEDNMKNCGYALRNWVNFLVLRQLYFRVLDTE